MWSRRIRVNREGFHDSEWTEEKRPGVLRVIVLGDSYVEGRALPLEKGLVGVARRRLEETRPGRFEVMNAAVASWGPDNAVAFLEGEAARWRPDLVVSVPFLGNDLVEGDPDSYREIWRWCNDLRRYPKTHYLPAAGGWTRRPYSVRFLSWGDALERRSRIHRAAWKALDAGLGGNTRMKRRGLSYNGYMRARKGLDHYRRLLADHLAHQREASAALGAGYIVLLIPNFTLYEPSAPPSLRPEEVEADRENEAALLRLLAERGIDAASTGEALRRASEEGRPVTFGRWDQHLNEEGHAVVGSALAAGIARARSRG